MKMQSGSELDMSKICHRCGNRISWWDRFRGYKTQCPSCEKIVHEMVSSRILAAKNPPQQPQTIPTGWSSERDSWMNNASQASVSASAPPRPTADMEFFREQMRRSTMQGISGTAFMGGSTAVNSIHSWNSQPPWDQQQQWMQQQQQLIDMQRRAMMAQRQSELDIQRAMFQSQADPRMSAREFVNRIGRTIPGGVWAEIMRVSEARARGFEDAVRGFNPDDMVEIHWDANTGQVIMGRRVEIRNAPSSTESNEPPVA